MSLALTHGRYDRQVAGAVPSQPRAASPV